MKNLLLALAAMALLASCQPSSTTPSSTETLTQASSKEEMQGNHEQATLSLSAGKKVNRKKGVVTGNPLFQSYLKEFPQGRLPMALNAATTKSIKREGYLSYKFERFVPGMAGERFSREVGKEYFAVARISQTPQYTAVIYGVKNVMMGDNAPTGYMLTTYARNGKMIDQILAGGLIDPEKPLRAGTISADLSIDIKYYQQHWANDPSREGYFENRVIRTTLRTTRHFHIAGNGRIEEDGRLLGMR